MLTENATSEVGSDPITANLDILTAQHEQLDRLEWDQANAPRKRSQKLNKLSVLVPLFNERWTIEPVLRKVLDAPVDLELEVIVVDDGSVDGSPEVVERLTEKDERIKLIRHERNSGKGTAIRTAIDNLSGDVAIIQDADLEYDPNDYPRLLRPILEGHADAVFGSRFAGEERRVLLFWHSLGNKLLTLFCNALNDLNLTDMETCYKVIRTDVLQQLRLESRTFTIEPELTTRLSQWGARIYEVPISYRGRNREEGKKIRATDGIKALWSMLRCRFWDNRFTSHTGMYVLRSVQKATRYNSWLIQQVAPYLGKRVAEAGAGIGNLSRLLTEREHLLLVDHDPIYLAVLEDHFKSRGNIRVLKSDLTEPDFENEWQEDQLDTIFCSNVIEHLGPDGKILRGFHKALEPGGNCIIIVPARPELYNGLDKALGHHRRYLREELRQLMEGAGFEVIHQKQVCRIGALAWFFNGRLLRRKQISPRQMMTFDKVWPALSKIDHLLPWKGMSLIMVGRKPTQSGSSTNGRD